MILNELITRDMTFACSVSYLCMKKEIKRVLLYQACRITFLLEIHLRISGLVRPLSFDLQVTVKFFAHCCDAYFT